MGKKSFFYLPANVLTIDSFDFKGKSYQNITVRVDGQLVKFGLASGLVAEKFIDKEVKLGMGLSVFQLKPSLRVEEIEEA